ncbi:hypothetical protein BB561_000404 [Smittium simulii]|uniref:ABC1 atypical kinase-like domain-containing protein n=1 Tax=Smittium simulii TaxID=133385 RepID=A0A2T9YZB2_9FUNG|nr:hypothetical protein BB561_000404 [Smittium simulii]
MSRYSLSGIRFGSRTMFSIEQHRIANHTVFSRASLLMKYKPFKAYSNYPSLYSQNNLNNITKSHKPTFKFAENFYIPISFNFTHKVYFTTRSISSNGIPFSFKSLKKNKKNVYLLLCLIFGAGVFISLQSSNNKQTKLTELFEKISIKSFLGLIFLHDENNLNKIESIVSSDSSVYMGSDVAQVVTLIQADYSLTADKRSFFNFFLPTSVAIRIQSFITSLFINIANINTSIFSTVAINVIEPFMIITRFFYLLALFIPVVCTVPAYLAFTYFCDCNTKKGSMYVLWWYRFISHQMSRAGPTFIKLSQWAATRTDIFPSDFCLELSKFHSKNKAHSFEYTLNSIQKTFQGIDINTVFEWIEEEPLGVGAIAQVHKAKFKADFIEKMLIDSRKIMESANSDSQTSSEEFVNDHPEQNHKLAFGGQSSIDYTISYINSIFPLLISQKPTGNINSNFWDRTRFEKLSQFLNEHQVVAIKTLHPNVENFITRDLKIIYFFAKLVSMIPTLKWLSLDEEASIFGDLMKSQLDLRVEAAHLVILDKNFDSREKIDFPIPIVQLSSKSVLIETIASGIPLNTFLENLPNPFGPETAKLGLDAFMRMLISDNFVHSDLHPGNILVNLTPPPPLSKSLKFFSKLFNFKKSGNQKPDSQIQDENSSYTEANKSTIVEEYPTEAQVNERVRELSEGGEQSKEEFYEYMAELYSVGYRPRLTFLDSGLVTVLDKVSRRNFMDLFEAICCFDGYKAGQLMVKRSKNPEVVYDPIGFAKKVHVLVNEIRKSSLSLSQVTASQILSEMLDNARFHHVRIDPHFVNVAVAILILEGIGRQLDNNMDLLNASLPILREYLRYEAQQSLKNVKLDTEKQENDNDGTPSHSKFEAKDIDDDVSTNGTTELQYKLGFLKLYVYAEVKNYFDSVSNMLYSDNFEFFGEFSPFIEFLG